MERIAINCLDAKYQYKKGKKKRYHVHATKHDEHVHKNAREYSSNKEEYVLISTLTGIVTHGSDY